MTWWHRLWRRAQLEDQLEKELRFHLEQHTADLIARGHHPAEAQRLARLALGGPDQVKEGCRDARGTRPTSWSASRSRPNRPPDGATCGHSPIRISSIASARAVLSPWLHGATAEAPSLVQAMPSTWTAVKFPPNCFPFWASLPRQVARFCRRKIAPAPLPS